MYLLLDANVTAGYYLSRSLDSKRAASRIENILNSIRSGATDHFLYIPNFCIAEVFSTFMKYAFETLFVNQLDGSVSCCGGWFSGCEGSNRDEPSNFRMNPSAGGRLEAD